MVYGALRISVSDVNFPNSLSIILEVPRVHLLTDFVIIPLVSTI